MSVFAIGFVLALSESMTMSMVPAAAIAPPPPDAMPVFATDGLNTYSCYLNVELYHNSLESGFNWDAYTICDFEVVQNTIDAQLLKGSTVKDTAHAPYGSCAVIPCREVYTPPGQLYRCGSGCSGTWTAKSTHTITVGAGMFWSNPSNGACSRDANNTTITCNLSKKKTV